MTAMYPTAALAAPATSGRWAAFVPPLVAIALSFGLAALLPRETVIALIHENGPVENLTVVLYLVVAAALWFVRRPIRHAWERTGISLMLLAFAARELDFHKLFTGTSVLKVSFYLRDAPLHQKLVALPIVLAVALTGLLLLRRFARPLWQDLRRGRALAITAAVFFATLVATKIIDRSFAILAEDFGIVMSLGVDTVLSALEEIGECSLPLIAAVGVVQYHRGG